MKFEFIEKLIPKKFVIIRGKEVSVECLYRMLEEFVQEDCINDYNVVEDIAEILVEEGVLEKQSGSRNAIYYCAADKFEEYHKEFLKAYWKEDDKNDSK